MKCQQCDYVAKNPDPMIAKRSLAIHMSKSHGVAGKAEAKRREAPKSRAGAAIATPAGESPTAPLRPSYREALEDAASAGQALGNIGVSVGEMVAGLVLFLEGMGRTRAEMALGVLGWKKEKKQ